MKKYTKSELKFLLRHQKFILGLRKELNKNTLYSLAKAGLRIVKYRLYLFKYNKKRVNKNVDEYIKYSLLIDSISELFKSVTHDDKKILTNEELKTLKNKLSDIFSFGESVWSMD